MYTYLPSPMSLPPSSPIPPLQVITGTKLRSLCYAAASHQLSIPYLVACISQCSSQFIPLLPPLCLHVCSVHLYLSSCPANRFLCAVFLDSTCLRNTTVSMRGPQAVMNLPPLEGSRDCWQGIPSRWVLGSWTPAGMYLAPRRAGSVPLRESRSACFPELPAGITLVR